MSESGALLGHHAVDHRQDLPEVAQPPLPRREHGVGLGEEDLQQAELQHPLHGGAGVAALAGAGRSPR